MDLGPGADGELLQRALDGEAVTDPGILELVAVVHAVTALDQAALAPRAEFVSDLRARLLADDGTTVLSTLPGADDGERDGSDGGLGGPGGPGRPASVVRIAARPLRYVAAAAASILLVGGVLGIASRSAAPGDVLYPVKQALDRVAVRLAGSGYDEGLTYLAQAQQHIDEARDLLDRGAASAADVNMALDAASDSTQQAQRTLLDVYRTQHRGEALTELDDFYTRAIPQVDALRDRVPPASQPSWQHLRDLLGQGRIATLRELAACVVCGDRALEARQVLATLPGGGATGVATVPATGGQTAAPGRSGPATSGPGQPAAGGDASGQPGVSVTGGVTLPGATANLPGVGVHSTGAGAGGGGVTLPGSTVNLPSAGITSTGIGVGGGGVTLPGVTASLPSASSPCRRSSCPDPNDLRRYRPPHPDAGASAAL
ncbi:hypothetical protein GCM10027053_13560 [Intrasporangium mesophilum]